MFNKEYERYIRSKAWREKADERLCLDNHTCCVCGKPATDVHHITYENLGNEKMDDLVSLCRDCHNEAERLYDEAPGSWGKNFMAKMRIDAEKVGEEIYAYLTQQCGDDFDSLMLWREPENNPTNPFSKDKYWAHLKQAACALCGKRYYRNCASDRQDITLDTITSHVVIVVLGNIEHILRNKVQGSLHKDVLQMYAKVGKWKDVAAALGIKDGTLRKLRSDDGTSAGPTLYQSVFYYCGKDALLGIKPDEDIECLTDEDRALLNSIAERAQEVIGSMPDFQFA